MWGARQVRSATASAAPSIVACASSAIGGETTRRSTPSSANADAHSAVNGPLGVTVTSSRPSASGRST